MNTELQKAKEILQQEGYTCVMCKDDRIYTSEFRGVKPLVAWYAAKEDLSGFSAADRVVGRATAFLYRLLGVKAVYAGVISKPALAVLEENHIDAEYGTLVENIINRQGDGICPFEAAVSQISNADEAYLAIRAKMAEMNIQL